MTKDKIIETVLCEKIIVIVRGVEKNKLLPLAQAMYDGGIRLMEITYCSDGKTSDEETVENIKMLTDKFGDKMIIGAGTVLNENQVKLTYKAGGQFIVSPDTNMDVIERTNKLGMVSVPGALTPTEIQQAHLIGADFVKLFPVTTLGTDYVKLVSTPLSHINLLAVGGIEEDNIKEYLKAGASGFCIGGRIADKKLLEENNYDEITKRSKTFTDLIKSI